MKYAVCRQYILMSSGCCFSINIFPSYTPVSLSASGRGTPPYLSSHVWLPFPSPKPSPSIIRNMRTVCLVLHVPWLFHFQFPLLPVEQIHHLLIFIEIRIFKVLFFPYSQKIMNQHFLRTAQRTANPPDTAGGSGYNFS